MGNTMDNIIIRDQILNSDERSLTMIRTKTIQSVREDLYVIILLSIQQWVLAAEAKGNIP